MRSTIIVSIIQKLKTFKIILDLKNKYKSHLQEETNCKIGKNINFVRETELKAKISMLIELESKLGYDK